MSNDIASNLYPDGPSINQIEEMLNHFSPQPTTRFYRKMQNAPWLQTTSSRKELYLSIRPARKLIWATIISLLIVVLISVTFFPSLRVIARQIIYSFISGPSDQLNIEVTLSNPGDLYNFTAPENFPLRINDVRQQAGFFVKEITSTSGDLKLVGARLDPSYNAAIILYQGDNYKLFLTQRPVGNNVDVFSIGPSAQVNLVKIGDAQGEFVVGGWKAISTQNVPDPLNPGTQTNINAIWDNDLPQSTLRWQTNGYVYEIRTIGEGSPSQSVLITIANELK
jgi:hypothetical protein